MPYSLVVEPSDVGSEPVVVLLTVITLPINYYTQWGRHISEMTSYIM